MYMYYSVLFTLFKQWKQFYKIDSVHSIVAYSALSLVRNHLRGRMKTKCVLQIYYNEWCTQASAYNILGITTG